MLNPDGVVVGNYRCSLAGLDLNREYREPGVPSPTIKAFKDLVRGLMREREVVLLCDLHGHSRKHGVFAYGCEKAPKDATPAAPGWPVPGSLGGLAGVPSGNQARLFPLMLHLNAPDLFCYRSCNFAVSRLFGGQWRCRFKSAAFSASKQPTHQLKQTPQLLCRFKSPRQAQAGS